jgi:hypothetical protein
LVLAALATVVLGIGLEFGQLDSSGRSFEIADMAADTIGVCLGLTIGIPVRSSGVVRSFLRPDPGPIAAPPGPPVPNGGSNQCNLVGAKNVAASDRSFEFQSKISLSG